MLNWQVQMYLWLFFFSDYQNIFCHLTSDMPQKNVSILSHVLHLLYDFWFPVNIFSLQSSRMCKQGNPIMNKSQEKM